MTFPLIAFLLAGIALEEGPVQPPLQVGAHLRLAFGFDWDGLGFDGTPAPGVITEVVFRFSAPGGDPVRWTRLMPPAKPVVVGTNSFPYSEVFRDVPPGLYTLDCSIRNAAGPGSYSAPPLLIEVIGPPQPEKRPSQVTNLRGGLPLPEET